MQRVGMPWLAMILGVAACSDPAGLSDAAPRPDAAAGDAQPVPVDAADAAPCTVFSARPAGSVVAGALDELSGLATSRAYSGLLYAHNDSGDGARVFLLGPDGRDLGVVSLTGASHRDYEDMAVGPGPDGTSHVYVGDVGDNAARTGSGPPRTSITVYRFAEADLAFTGTDASASVAVEALEFTYPDAPHDCESIAVDGGGDLFLLSKEDRGPSTLYVARAPLASGVLESLGTLRFPDGAPQATAMDFAPGDGAALVRTYNRVHLYPRDAAQTWADALMAPPLVATARPEAQGEAIAWRQDGRGYRTASEGSNPPLFLFEGPEGCQSW